MTNIIPFPAASRAELDGGFIRDDLTPSKCREAFYFIDLVEADGSRFCMWDGNSYDEALAVLGEFRRGGIATRDLLRGH
ncbi:hypothetical protein J5J86_20755 [Aquabacter sp. L1I39]|uniref:hypothetical protein n=1 Tax=Aquabacter sp. L1I39 TaxID=2820278 RepID=UPI001ADB36BF|nr:hypothetical protein [Aquabacter sp. L1I39]QTL03156.1 hypothetical protein J5J86_20755 [Aquabacter sp. L1I39]